MKTGNFWSRPVLLGFLLFLFCLSCTQGAASTASVTSDMTGPLILAGELSLLAESKEKALNGAKALFATGVITQVLKLTVREKRPDSNDTDSFPSAHTAGAFAMATVYADDRPGSKWLAYGVAGAVGWSRVEEDRHTWGDVLAGALIGYFTASRFTNRHVAITPQGIGFQANW